MLSLFSQLIWLLAKLTANSSYPKVVAPRSSTASLTSIHGLRRRTSARVSMIAWFVSTRKVRSWQKTLAAPNVKRSSKVRRKFDWKRKLVTTLQKAYWWWSPKWIANRPLVIWSAAICTCVIPFAWRISFKWLTTSPIRNLLLRTLYIESTANLPEM